MKQNILAPLAIGLSLISTSFAEELPIEQLNLPAGFTISVFAEVPNARQMARGKDGTIYVGSRRLGKVHAVRDNDGDFKADRVIEIDTDLNLPSGLAIQGEDLYVGAVDRILKYPNIAAQLDSPPEPLVIIDDLPDKRHHGWKFIDFGPDNLLYIPVGAPCNICLSEDERFATILRVDVNDPKPEIVAHGVRNSVGFDWHPVTGELWFTDNGRDLLGDDLPPCELNRVTRTGQHFGYPFFHADDIRDPEFGGGKEADDYERPELALGPHTAPLGMLFYTGAQFPDDYKNQPLIAEHGSWNRSKEAGHTGYRITMGQIKEDGRLQYSTVIDGWLNDDNSAWGRPVDLLQLPDGSVLISDDHAGVIYRLTYKRI